MPLWVWRALKAARRVPWTKVWAAVIWLATVGREYWDRLTPKERRELRDLMRSSPRGADPISRIRSRAA